MPWSNNSGGPWGGGNRGGGSGSGGGNGNSPWGRPSGGGGGGPFGNRPPPDVEELLRRSQDKVKNMLPSGMGWKGGALLGLAAVLVWLGTGFYQVEPSEQGVELVFGELTQITQPGLNYNWPAPIGETMTPAVAANNQVDVGYRSTGGRTPTGPRDVPEESLMVTGDENIIDIQFAVRWKIREVVDPSNLRESGAAQFLLNVRNPEETVKVAAEAAMREMVGQSNFETIRTQDRQALALNAQELIQQILDEYRSGIEILEVNPQKVDPPGPIFDAFRDVQAAQADKERLINQANAFLNEVTERAQGSAERILRDAEAYKEERIAQATGDASRFLAVYEEFRNAPEVTKRRIYLQTMEEIMQNMNKVLIETGPQGAGGSSSGVVPYLPLNELTNRPPRPAN